MTSESGNIRPVELSVIIPLFNEEGNIEALHSALKKVLNETGLIHEIIFVDDGSRDGSLLKVFELSEQDSAVKGISLSRNFGHQIALLAGLEHAKGEITVSLDADLQHPPAVIAELLNKFREGYDIVNTFRVESVDATRVKKLTSGYFYKIINSMSEVKMEPAAADFRLMNRKATDALLSLREKDRFTRGLVSWMGFKQAIIPYSAPPRFSGKSKYSYAKMIIILL